MLLARVDPGLFRLGTGILLVAFSAVMLADRPRRQLARGGAGADAAIGFAGGIMGGLAGLSGPLPTMWATLRPWGKDERRGVFQAFNLTILSATPLAPTAAGMMSAEVGRLLLLALPGTLTGACLRSRVFKHPR